MTAAEATPEIELDKADRAFLGHPKGLGFLAFVEGCERFSYYSMQTLLVLYMVKYLLLPENIGNVAGLQALQNGWYGGLQGQPLASAIFGDYTALVYLTPILGGIIADRWLGRRTTLILGGAVMALGHFLMAFEGAFLFALLSLVVGVGLFKGNIATQVGELYGPSDLRRAMAFQIFYIAIQVSVIAAPLVSGTLGEEVGWHYGFGCAGVVMVAGLLLYLYAKPWLPADNRARSAARMPGDKLQRRDVPRLLVLLLLIPILALALMVNQEIFNAYLVWADEHFQLTFFGRTVPTSWMITLDATASFTLLVAVTAFWKWHANRTGSEPDELGKMIIGSAFSVAGAMCLVIAAATQGEGKIGLFWPVMFHILNSIGFAHTLPVSLALFTKVAPKALTGTVVGLYYLAFFATNKIVGTVGGWYSTMDTVQFWLLHAGAAAVGLVAFAVLKLTLGRVLAD
ncbi:POT family proton-dependent oligopeptide transporter [Novosphingobium chloroacetimidivorans]|uniref:POT family proton-dependent oligopeptide transporter n=1 Tax=Novosphingobium chloroacetimidivorans TaxID=1428314 RepID=A0A7W7KBJ7_9SPHN|nr:peptide MFS transporter [Novosphingobium chloroacetimidivorans]MBB4859799.1 POT family proton-dependent oligopeptide transporter [Novosphingobium chloroacetimidivorans]